MAINWIPIFKKHKGQWVALGNDQKTVIASGQKAKAVMESAKKKGHSKPFLFRVPTHQQSYVGYAI